MEIHVLSFGELSSEIAYWLWQLRTAIFVVEQACPYQELDGRDLEPAARHVFVTDEGHPVAYLRLLRDASGDARIGRVCVAVSHRSGGLAGRLMAAALIEIGEGPAVLDAQAHLAGWYARFGFEVSGPGFVEDGIPHVPMRRTR